MQLGFDWAGLVSSVAQAGAQYAVQRSRAKGELEVLKAQLAAEKARQEALARLAAERAAIASQEGLPYAPPTQAPTVVRAAPKPTSDFLSNLPPWAIPAAVGGVVLLLLLRR
jgi:hypothetical protein